MNDELLVEQLRALGESDDRRVGAAFFNVAVVRRVNDLPPPATIRRRRVIRRVAAGLLVAILGVAPGPRTAFARWLGIGSVRVETGTSGRNTNIGVPAPLGALDLGRRSTMRDASERLGHHVAVLRGRTPTSVWVQSLDAGRPNIVSVNTVYADGRGIILVNELPGPGSVYVNKKLLVEGTQIDFLTIRNQSALWFGGAPHEVGVVDASGKISMMQTRLAGNVLLWADTTRTIRIEGVNDKATAVALLESLVF
jgi:hypothetical protein